MNRSPHSNALAEPVEPIDSRGPATTRRGFRWHLVGCLLGVWVMVLAAPLQLRAEEFTVDLTPRVKQQLGEIVTAWQTWEEAFRAGDSERADKALDNILSNTRGFGFQYLPDLSIAAAAHAVQAAGQGDAEAAQTALLAAQKLDPERPEIDFAAATIKRLQGDYAGAIGDGLSGYVKLSKLPLERGIWLQNIAIWLIYVLILSGVIFLALQMAVKGKSLFYDLSRMLSPPLPGPVADLIAIMLLVWPIFLPSGVLWLALYWSVLLFGYGSLSEKTIFVILWTLVAATPMLLSYQQLAAQLRMIPPTRALDQFQSDRLYGTLFNDVGLLQGLLPDSLASREVIADLHRQLGQWDQARSIYSFLADNPDQRTSATTAPLSNLGLYHLRMRDYETAKTFFKQATEADSSSVEAFYNLSQAHSLLYDFDNTSRTLARAQALNREKVEVWTDLKVPPERSGVAIDGGLRRYPEIREDLRKLWGGGESGSLADLWRRNFSMSILFATLLLAITLHMVRLQLGYRSSLLGHNNSSSPAWLRAFVPGLSSAQNGDGFWAFLGIAIPTGLVILPLLRAIGYRTPLGLDPGQWLPMVVSVVALLIVMLIRLGWAMAADS